MRGWGGTFRFTKRWRERSTPKELIRKWKSDPSPPPSCLHPDASSFHLVGQMHKSTRNHSPCAPGSEGPFLPGPACSGRPLRWLLLSIKTRATTARARLADPCREDRGNRTTKTFTRGGRSARSRIRTVTRNLYPMLQPPQSPSGRLRVTREVRSAAPSPFCSEAPRDPRAAPGPSPPPFPPLAHLRPLARPRVPCAPSLSRAGKLPRGAQREARAGPAGRIRGPGASRPAHASRLGRSPRSPPIAVTAGASGCVRTARPLAAAVTLSGWLRYAPRAGPLSAAVRFGSRSPSSQPDAPRRGLPGSEFNYLKDKKEDQQGRPCVSPPIRTRAGVLNASAK